MPVGKILAATAIVGTFVLAIAVGLAWEFARRIDAR